MAAESKSRRQRPNLWDAESNHGLHNDNIKINTPKETKLKSQFSYVDSPYLQSLLPLLPKHGKHVHKKTLSKPFKINRAATAVNATALNHRPTTHSHSDKKLTTNKDDESTFRQRPITSLQCQITLKFISNHSTCFPGHSHQICVQQQHCGGNPISVYQGWHIYGDKFSFISRRQQGFPFSVTLAINNILNLQLSACCEYKYQRGSKLGGGKSQFVLIGVKGSFPCYRCQLRRKQTAGSITSTQSSENSKVEDDESEFSNGGELNDCNDHNSDYEDDFEEEEDVSKPLPDPCRSDECDTETKIGEIELADIINSVTLETEKDTVENETEHDEIDLPKATIDIQSIYEDLNEETRVKEVEQNTDQSHSHLRSPEPALQLESEANSPISTDPINPTPVEPSPVEHNVINSEESEENFTQEQVDLVVTSDKELSDNEDIDNEENTTNDDAERSVTSNSEPSDNSDTDEDVCYSFEAAPTSSNSNYQRDSSDLFRVEKNAIYNSRAQFDSSDDEDDNHSPHITIWADVHACELESPQLAEFKFRGNHLLSLQNLPIESCSC